MSHYVASHETRGTEFIDSERGIYLLTTGRGAAGGLGPSKLTWAVEEAAADLRSRIDGYERAPSGETRRAVIETLEAVLDGTGPGFLLGRAPDGKPDVSFVLVLVGPAFAFVAHRGESRLDVVREGQVHRITAVDGAAKVLHLDLLPADRLILSSRGFPKGAKPPTKALAATPQEAAMALLTLAQSLDPLSTVAVVDPPASAQAEALLARARALGKLFLFDELSFESRLLVNAICHRRTLKPGEEVVREGTAGNAMFVVVKGHLAVTLNGVELTKLKGGDHFGELSLAEDSVRSATVTAIDNALVVEISRRDLAEFSKGHPEEGLQIAWRLVRYLGARVRDLSEKVAGP